MLCRVLKLYALVSVAGLVLMVWSLVEAISTDESRIRHLPKIAWILLVLFFPLAGSIAWLAAGRPARNPSAHRAHRRRSPSTTDRAAPPRPTPPRTRSSCGRSVSGRRSSAAGTTRSAATSSAATPRGPSRPRTDRQALAASYRPWMTSLGASLGWLIRTWLPNGSRMPKSVP